MNPDIKILGDAHKKGDLDAILKRGEEYLRKKALDEKLGKKKSPEQTRSQILTGDYDWVQADTYGKALTELIKDPHSNPFYTFSNGSGIVRPLTFKETIQARVDAYNSGKTEDEKKKLFSHNFSTCTGITYQANSDKFKIIPVCKELIALDEYFKEHAINCDYQDLDGIELDRTKARYTDRLSQDEVIKHPAWLAAVEMDKSLLKEYAGIIFKEFKGYSAMGFWLYGPDNNQLRTLELDNSSSGSNAVGYYGLDGVARFLRICSKDSHAGKKGGSK